jgi:hypothetical protein
LTRLDSLKTHDGFVEDVGRVLVVKSVVSWFAIDTVIALASGEKAHNTKAPATTAAEQINGFIAKSRTAQATTVDKH